MPPLVQTERLTKHYGPVAALDDCTLAIEQGEIFGLLGPNGSGKTTLIRLLMGFLRPTHGWGRIAGLDCYRQSVAVHRQVAYMPGDSRLFRAMSGRDVLKFFSRVRPGGNLRTALDLAELLQLDLSRTVSFCSTGMRQKLALVAALSADTPLLILDEPTSNLDPTVRGDVLELVRRAQAAGRTVLFSSHVLSEVEQVCHRVAIVRRGRLAHLQVMSELLRQHRIRAQLTGPLPSLPKALAGQLEIQTDRDGQLTVLTPGELSPLLGWLSSLPIRQVQIEPVGLRAIYDRYHAGELSDNTGNGNSPSATPTHRTSATATRAQVPS